MTDSKDNRSPGDPEEGQASGHDTAPTIFGAPGQLLVGTLLDDRFLIEKDLTEGGADKGGMGLVYLAKDMKLMGKKAVVKILRKEALENEDIERKFLHEKEALIRLDHPNIVRILDTGTLSDGNLFMVMEYIPGYSLRKLLREQTRLPIDHCADLVRQITDALAAAHSEKILHRDIKPENIMLTPQEAGFERVRLIDFGVAKVEESKLAPQTQISTGMGTPMYMAPEQLHGDLSPTSAMDVYSSAIVFYEILTGEKPFNPRSLIEMFELQKEGVKTPPRELRPSIPVPAQDILLAALAFKADDRPADIRQFGIELSNALVSAEAAADDSLASTRAGELPPTREFKPIPTGTQMGTATEGAGSRTGGNAALLQTSENEPAAPSQSREARQFIYVLGVFAAALVAVVAVFAGVIYWTGRDGPADDAASEQPQAASAEPSRSKNIATGSQVDEAAPVPEGPARELAFHLMVQKMRDGQPFEEPFRSSGREVFETGYKFRMIFEKVPAGYFYLFNEGKDASGTDVFNILFPTPVRNNGSALIAADGVVETGENTFAETRGTEYVWVVWTASEAPAVEAARVNAFENQGKVADPAVRTGLADFISRSSAAAVTVKKDSEVQSTFIGGTGDVLVYKIELEHR